MIVASIPGPASGTLSIGPIRLTAYGLMIALGIITYPPTKQPRPTAGTPTTVLTATTSSSPNTVAR